MCQLPDDIWIKEMKHLVLLYSDLFDAERVGQDIVRDDRDPIRVPYKTRSRITGLLKELESIQSTIKGFNNARYGLALENIRAAVLPESFRKPRGSGFIGPLVKETGWFAWWSCEARLPDVAARETSSPSHPCDPCDGVGRDQLRTCARVSLMIFID